MRKVNHAVIGAITIILWGIFLWVWFVGGQAVPKPTLTSVKDHHQSESGRSHTPEIDRFLEDTMSTIQRENPDITGQASKIALSIYINSKDFGLDPYLVTALILHESRFKINAVGSCGEIGLLQILPSTRSWIADRLCIPQSDVSLDSNIRMGCFYLSECYRWILESGNKSSMEVDELALLSYNMGIGSRILREILRGKNIPIHNSYAKKIIIIYDAIGGS